MALETVFIIILTTATVGHLSQGTSDHDTRNDDSISQCIAETKEAFDFKTRDAEELVGDIEECYQTDDDN